MCPDRKAARPELFRRAEGKLKDSVVARVGLVGGARVDKGRDKMRGEKRRGKKRTTAEETNRQLLLMEGSY